MMGRRTDVFDVTRVVCDAFPAGPQGHAFGRLQYGDDRETVTVFLSSAQLMELAAQVAEATTVLVGAV